MNEVVLVLHIVRSIVFLAAALAAVGIFFVVIRRRDGVNAPDTAADRDGATLWRAMDRMELRLETLERLLTTQRGDRADVAEDIFAPVEDDRHSGRSK
jgi:hypothetical protein